MAQQVVTLAKEETSQAILDILNNSEYGQEALEDILTNSSYGLNAIRGLVSDSKSLLQNSTYGLSALKTKMNGVEVKSENIKSKDHIKKLAGLITSKKQNRVLSDKYIFKTFSIRSNNGSNIRYGLENVIGNLSNNQEYVFLGLAVKLSCTIPPLGRIVGSLDIILSDNISLRMPLAGYNTSSRDSKPATSNTLMIFPAPEILPPNFFRNQLRVPIGSTRMATRLQYDMISGFFKTLYQHSGSSDYVPDEPEYNKYRFDFLNNAIVTRDGTSSLSDAKDYNFYYFDNPNESLASYVNDGLMNVINLGFSENNYNYKDGELNNINLQDNSPTYRIMNKLIKSNYFDIKIETYADASYNFDANSGIRPINIDGSGSQPYAVFMKLEDYLA